MTEMAIIPYEPPSLVLDDDLAVHPWVAWAVGGLAWGTALWYAWWCRRNGGYPDIRIGWSGFRVACHK